MLHTKKVRFSPIDMPRIVQHVGDVLGFLGAGPCALSMFYVNSKYFQMYVLGAMSGLGVSSGR